MEQRKTIFIALSTLIIGVVIGYCLWGSKPLATTGGHMMPDGTAMSDTGMMDMSSMMADMNTTLNGKTGNEFDKAFIAEMIVHHRGAIDMAELALTNAQHQEIKTLAREIILAQTKEIAQMKSWQAA